MPTEGIGVSVTQSDEDSAVVEVRGRDSFRKVMFSRQGTAKTEGKMPWGAAQHPVGEFLRSTFSVRDGFDQATMSRLLRAGPWPLDERGVEVLTNTEPDLAMGTQLGLVAEELGFVFNLVRESVLAIHLCALTIGMEPKTGVVVSDAIPAMVQVLTEMFREELNDHS